MLETCFSVARASSQRNLSLRCARELLVLTVLLPALRAFELDFVLLEVADFVELPVPDEPDEDVALLVLPEPLEEEAADDELLLLGILTDWPLSILSIVSRWPCSFSPICLKRFLRFLSQASVAYLAYFSTQSFS